MTTSSASPTPAEPTPDDDAAPVTRVVADAVSDGPQPAAPTPAGDEVEVVLGSFDRRVDDLLERLRGHPVADRVFLTATQLGDFSLVWHIVNVSRGLTSDRRAGQVPVLAIALGLESLVVNQGIKRLFKRSRPTTHGDPRLPVRKPSTSSFPSGHASAAAFTAVLLTGWDGRRLAPLWWTVAGTVAASRAYVRIHWPSDVVAGLATGAALGVGARAVLRRIGHA